MFATMALLVGPDAGAQRPSSVAELPGGATSQAIVSEGSDTAAPPNATVRQPRPFGYVIGDVVTQRVLLSLDGHRFEPAELPRLGRAGVWYERRSVRTEEDARGQLWLAVEYQLLNAPQTLAVASIPPWKLRSKNGDAELRIGAWPITVGPMTPPVAAAGIGPSSLRPDHAVSPVSVAPFQQGRVAALTGLTLTLLAWIGWWAWRNRQASMSQPFAVALKSMRGIDDAAPQAWHALHRAFDETAGRTLRIQSLPELFRQAPHLQPLQPQIERFFAQSAARFFGDPSPQPAMPVHELCRELRRLEKRHEP